MKSDGQSEQISTRSGEVNLKSGIEVHGENTNETDPSLFSDRPIVCILEEEDPNKGLESQEKRRSRMFKVVRSKGKALASGGFGVTIAIGSQTNTEDATAEEEIENDSEEEQQEGSPPLADEVNNEEKDMTPTKSAEYLFIEEVLFLHEKGLLRALVPSKDTSTSKASQDSTNAFEAASPLDTSQLYQLLPSLGVSLAIYRVYSHLRSQDFRVLRHDPSRYEILCQQKEDTEERRRRKILLQEVTQKQQESSANTEPSSGETKETQSITADSQNSSKPLKLSVRLRRRIRESIQHAPPPIIPTTNCMNGDDQNSRNKIGICWDAYNPNSNFGKTHPGFPDFYVTVTYYNIPMVVFSDVNILLKDKCNGIPLKVATVSDSGTVVMFGVTDYGIPSLTSKVETRN